MPSQSAPTGQPFDSGFLSNLLGVSCTRSLAAPRGFRSASNESAHCLKLKDLREGEALVALQLEDMRADLAAPSFRTAMLESLRGVP
jgi:hypothetical protein